MNREELREELAALQHDQWAGWMEYLFSKCQQRGAEGTVLPLPSDEDVVIPAAYAHNLARLMRTPYAELTEQEKESDRIEADKYLPFITAAETRWKVEVLEKVKGRLNEQWEQPGTTYGDTGLPNPVVVYGYNEAIGEMKDKIDQELTALKGDSHGG